MYRKSEIFKTFFKDFLFFLQNVLPDWVGWVLPFFYQKFACYFIWNKLIFIRITRTDCRLRSIARVSDPVWYLPDPDPTSQDKPDPYSDPTSQNFEKYREIWKQDPDKKTGPWSETLPGTIPYVNRRNVLLDRNFLAKVADFGLTVHRNKSSYQILN